MTASQLKIGDIFQTNDGTKYLVVTKHLDKLDVINEHGQLVYIGFNHYVVYLGRGTIELKVEKPKEYWFLVKDDSFWFKKDWSTNHMDIFYSYNQAEEQLKNLFNKTNVKIGHFNVLPV